MRPRSRCSTRGPSRAPPAARPARRRATRSASTRSSRRRCVHFDHRWGPDAVASRRCSAARRARGRVARAHAPLRARRRLREDRRAGSSVRARDEGAQPVLFPRRSSAVAMDRVLSSRAATCCSSARRASAAARRSRSCCHMHGLELFRRHHARLHGQVLQGRAQVDLPKVGVQGTPACCCSRTTSCATSAHRVRQLAALVGRAAGLFEPQELEPMLAPLKEEMGKRATTTARSDFFVWRSAVPAHRAGDGPVQQAFLCAASPTRAVHALLDAWMGSWSGLDGGARATAMAGLDEELPPPRGRRVKQMVQLHQRLEGARRARRDAAHVRRAHPGVAQDLRLAAAEDHRPRRAPARRPGQAARGETRWRADKTANEQRAADATGGGGPRDGADPASMEGTVEKRARWRPAGEAGRRR